MERDSRSNLLDSEFGPRPPNLTTYLLTSAVISLNLATICLYGTRDFELFVTLNLIGLTQGGVYWIVRWYWYRTKRKHDSRSELHDSEFGPPPPILNRYLLTSAVVSLNLATVCLFVTRNQPWTFELFIVLNVIGLTVGACVWVVQSNRFRRNPQLLMSKRKWREYRKALRNEREREQLRRQLAKDNHDTRLETFVTQNVVDPKLTNQRHEKFVSKMPFWQIESTGSGKIPKPVELIRQLLAKISKLVNR